MSALTLYADTDPATPGRQTSDPQEIQSVLAAVGVRFERWPTEPGIAPGATPDQVLAAYRDPVDRLRADRGYRTGDVVSITPDDPQRAAKRRKFLAEHTHGEDEVRFFAAGQGLFCLHLQGRVLQVLCTAGDLIAVPDRTPHWFDMGPEPAFVAIRLFSDPAGWVASFTGSDIADRFPGLGAR